MTRSIGTSCVSSSDQAASSLSRALYLADLAPLIKDTKVFAFARFKQLENARGTH